MISFAKADRFGKEVRYYDPEKKRFVTTEDQLNNDKSEKLKLMDQMMEIRLNKKQEYLEEEAQIRFEKKHKLEMFKIKDTEEEEELRQRNKKSPGVWSYEPDYYPWGKSKPSYSIAGRFGKGFLDGSNQNRNDYLNFETNAKMVANSLIHGGISLPNFGIINQSPPKYSFPKSKDRFELPNIKNSSTIGPGLFYNNDVVTINNNRNKVL